MIDGIHWRASTRASAGVDASLLDDLLAGRPVRSGDVAVDLTDGAGIELHLRPNTTLHASQDEDVLRLTVDDGEVLVDASSDARHITVTTPCATVDVNVATVGVVVGTDGTCVCIADGRVVAERLGSGERMPVDARQSWIAYADPAVPVLLSAFEGPGGLPDDYEREHLAPLRRFRADLAR